MINRKILKKETKETAHNAVVPDLTVEFAWMGRLEKPPDPQLALLVD